jgi:hypothetical protein
MRLGREDNCDWRDAATPTSDYQQHESVLQRDGRVIESGSRGHAGMTETGAEALPRSLAESAT